MYSHRALRVAAAVALMGSVALAEDQVFDFEVGEPIGSGDLLPRAAMTLDLDGDEWVDIAILTIDPADSAPMIRTWSNVEGSFPAFVDAKFTDSRALARFTEATPGDLEGDGSHAIYTFSGEIFRIDVDGADAAFVPMTQTGNKVAAMNIADLDGRPGDELIVTVGPVGNFTTSVYTSDGDGGLTLVSSIDHSFPNVGLRSNARRLTGDMDGNGTTDVVVFASHQFGADVRILWNDGNGILSIDERSDLDRFTVGYDTGVADIDGDGADDFLNGYTVELAIGTPQQRREDRVQVTGLYSQAADLDGDGKAEGIVIQSIVDVGFGSYSAPLTVLGKFEIPAGLDRRDRFLRLAGVADLDRDGSVDVVLHDEPVGTFTAMGVAVFRQVGFPVPAQLAVASEPLSSSGASVIEISGINFVPETVVESLGRVSVLTTEFIDATRLRVEISVPAGVGASAFESLRVVNPDGRADEVSVPVTGVVLSAARGVVRDRAGPFRDSVVLSSGIAFTDLSASGAAVDPRDGLSLEIGSGDDRIVIDTSATSDAWRRVRGREGEPSRWVWRSAPGAFPRVNVRFDTRKGRLLLRAQALELPASIDDSLPLRVVIAGESADLEQAGRVRQRGSNRKIILRR